MPALSLPSTALRCLLVASCPPLRTQISGDEVVVEDALDECCGFAHLGHALLKDSNKNMVAEVKRDGAVRTYFVCVHARVSVSEVRR